MTETLSSFHPSQKKLDKISIMLVDDHPLMRQALRSFLEKQPDFEVVAEISDGEEAVRMANQLLPDVVIMDISMPNLSGLEATRQIKAEHPNIAILVLTVHNDKEHILGMLEAGAAGYLTKSVFGEEVIHAIRGVIAGEMVLSASASRQLLKHVLSHATKPLVLKTGERLTVRDVEILRLAATGMSNKAIALHLGLSVCTIKGYLVDIFSKLQVASRTQAVVAGFRAGILRLDDLE